MEGLCRSIGGSPKGQGKSLLFPSGSHGTSKKFRSSLYFLSFFFPVFIWEFDLFFSPFRGLEI